MGVYLKYFSKKQILILLAEDLIENKSKTLSKVWNFLNVSDFKISSVKNSNKSFYLKKNKKFFLPLAKIFRDSLYLKF